MRVWRTFAFVTLALGLFVLESSRVSASESGKLVSYGGLTFQVPESWPILKPGHTTACDSAPPAVVVWADKSLADLPPCLETIAHGGTVLMLLAPNQTPGCPLPTDQVGGAGQTRRTTDVHDGITVALAETHLTGKVFDAFPASSRIAWNIQACFSDFPGVALVAYSSGGQGEGSVAQAVAVAESVTHAKSQ
jgi:hypothetical protein